MGTRARAALAANDDGGARGERDRRPVAGRIVVAQAADHRAHLPHDRIGDDARDVVQQAPSAIADPRRALDVGVARDGADRQRAIVIRTIVQFADAVDVDEDGRTRQAEPHRRNQALPARQHAGLGPVLLQVRERLVCRVGAKVIEGCRNHVANLLPRQCRACRATRASQR